MNPTAPRPHAVEPAPVLPAARIDAVRFAPFGTLVAAPSLRASEGRAINAGTSVRFDLVDDLALTAAGGRPQLAVFRASPREFPFSVTELECHRLGSQTFIPLGVARFVVVVAPAAPRPDLRALSAFVTDGRQGIVLHPGVWHHALLAIDAADFVVIERAANQIDCDLAQLDQAVRVTTG